MQTEDEIPIFLQDIQIFGWVSQVPKDPFDTQLHQLYRVFERNFMLELIMETPEI
jgi:hypothetical protein